VLIFFVLSCAQVILAVVISWLICLVLTKTNVLTDDKSQWGYYARTDIRMNAIYSSPWFRIPYPGQVNLYLYIRYLFFRKFRSLLDSILPVLWCPVWRLVWFPRVPTLNSDCGSVQDKTVDLSD
jgi:hypothetical protein